MSKKLTIWKSAAVGRSTGVSLRCNDCGVILSNMEAQDGITGRATVFCPRCQKTTMATAFVFCTGERGPLKVEDGERRLMVCEGFATAKAVHRATGFPAAVITQKSAAPERRPLDCRVMPQVETENGND